jgi:uncharacterized membrane protein YjjP (DUF1212 family)
LRNTTLASDRLCVQHARYAIGMSATPVSSSFHDRVRFVCDLARHLHQAGTSAPRLESAIDDVSARLSLSCKSLSTPTSVILSFADSRSGEGALSEHTQVLRLAPGEVDLRQLVHVDRVAERVAAGEIDIVAGRTELQELPPRRGPVANAAMAASFGLTSGAVSVLLRGSLADTLVAAALGTAIGALSLLLPPRPNLAAGFEAIVAFLAATLVFLIHAFWTPLSINSVMIASLIVLLPGLALTTAANELATQHLVSGMARLAGASAVLLKLGFGIAAATQVARGLGLDRTPIPVAALPDWAEWVALAIASLAFCVIFRAARRDWPLVIASAWLGYVCTRFGGLWLGAEFGVFVAGLVIGCASNLYATLCNRPGALVRVPGIILLVPGSVGLRSLFFAFERDVYLGLDTAFTVVILLASLVAGLLFSNVLVAPRRSLS